MAQKLHAATIQQPAATPVGKAGVAVDDDSAYAPKLVPMKDVDDVNMVSAFCQMLYNVPKTSVTRLHAQHAASCCQDSCHAITCIAYCLALPRHHVIRFPCTACCLVLPRLL